MFYFAETTTVRVVLWGMASDRYGRRSVLIFGPLGLSITMLYFGASTQFWRLVMFRIERKGFSVCWTFREHSPSSKVIKCQLVVSVRDV
jgi:MFS family permease